MLFQQKSQLLMTCVFAKGSIMGLLSCSPLLFFIYKSFVGLEWFISKKANVNADGTHKKWIKSLHSLVRLHYIADTISKQFFCSPAHTRHFYIHTNAHFKWNEGLKEESS